MQEGIPGRKEGIVAFCICVSQATEQQLYDLFAPIGEVLELYILRNSNGKSRGCAFVTYANKFLAQQAITQLNGKQVWPSQCLSRVQSCSFHASNAVQAQLDHWQTPQDDSLIVYCAKLSSQC